MRFGQATRLMREGKKVRREGWNGKGMFIFLVEFSDWSLHTGIEGVNDLMTLPFICMKTADNKVVPWLASQTDALAYDWQEVID